MKNIMGYIVFLFFYSQHTFYTWGDFYYWLYIFVIVLFLFIHYDAKFLLKKSESKNIIFIKSNYLVSIGTSLIYLISTFLFIIYVSKNKEIVSAYHITMLVIFSISHLLIPIYFTINFFKSFYKNKHDYISISNKFIEMMDNGKINRVDLNSINNTERFEVKNGLVMIGKHKMNIKQIGLSEISRNRLMKQLNIYLLLFKT